MSSFSAHMTTRVAALALVLACITSTAAAEPVDFTDAERARILQHSPLPPIPPDPTNRVADDPRAARLGRLLFFDTRFSTNGKISCATCHDPAQSFADGRPRGIGITEVARNTPALWNVAYNRWFFWDGRRDSLWAQALQPLEDHREIDGDRLGIAHAIHDDADLRRAYTRVFEPLPDLNDTMRFPPSAKPMPAKPNDPRHLAWTAMADADRDAVNRVFANVGKAIAAYQRRLVSHDSPFDRFARALRDDDETGRDALTPAARRGLQLFVGKANCRLCHSGPNFSDGEFHNTGVPPRSGRPVHDNGRYDAIPLVLDDPFNAAAPYSDDPTGQTARRLKHLKRSPDTWGRFKTPTLRNVARTAPYMHEGQFATLADVARFYDTREGAVNMGHHRETILTPLGLSAAERRDLVAFLESLTDESIAPDLLKPPPSPLLESGDLNPPGSESP